MLQFTFRELQHLHAGLLVRERHIQKLIAGWDASKGPIEEDLIKIYSQELEEVRGLIDRVEEEIDR